MKWYTAVAASTSMLCMLGTANAQSLQTVETKPLEIKAKEVRLEATGVGKWKLTADHATLEIAAPQVHTHETTFNVTWGGSLVSNDARGTMTAKGDVKITFLGKNQPWLLVMADRAFINLNRATGGQN